jgi:hypothetical protein
MPSFIAKLYVLAGLAPANRNKPGIGFILITPSRMLQYFAEASPANTLIHIKSAMVRPHKNKKQELFGY